MGTVPFSLDCFEEDELHDFSEDEAHDRIGSYGLMGETLWQLESRRAFLVWYGLGIDEVLVPFLPGAALVDTDGVGRSYLNKAYTWEWVYDGETSYKVVTTESITRYEGATTNVTQVLVNVYNPGSTPGDVTSDTFDLVNSGAELSCSRTRVWDSGFTLIESWEFTNQRLWSDVIDEAWGMYSSSEWPSEGGPGIITKNDAGQIVSGSTTAGAILSAFAAGFGGSWSVDSKLASWTGQRYRVGAWDWFISEQDYDSQFTPVGARRRVQQAPRYVSDGVLEIHPDGTKTDRLPELGRVDWTDAEYPRTDE